MTRLMLIAAAAIEMACLAMIYLGVALRKVSHGIKRRLGKAAVGGL